MIKVAIFDMGGVVTSQKIFNKEFDRIIEGMFGEKDIKFSNPKFHFLFDSFTKLETDEITDKQFWQEFSQKLNKPYNPKLENVFIDIAKKLKPRPSVKRLLNQIKNKGIKIVVLSNVWSSFANYNYQFGYYEFFDHVFLSNELKLRKPDKKIYNYVLDRLSIKPEEAVFIDDMEHNIIAAKEIGINSFIYKNTSKLKRDLISIGIEL